MRSLPNLLYRVSPSTVSTPSCTSICATVAQYEFFPLPTYTRISSAWWAQIQPAAELYEWPGDSDQMVADGDGD